MRFHTDDARGVWMKMAGRCAIGLLLGLMAVLMLGLVLPLGDAQAGEDSTSNSRGALKPMSADPIPPGGDCIRTGWKYSDNPFSGWPLLERVCDRSLVVWTYCSEQYLTAYPHWGVDFAYKGIEGAEVVATADRAIVGRMHDEGCWNGGMGNYVELHAVNCWQEPLAPRCRDDVCVELLAHVYGLEGPSYDLHFQTVEFCEPTYWLATYMHLKEVTVGVGQMVERGDVIGLVGATGNAGGAHLHYQITSPYDAPGGAVDPFPTLCETWIGE
jgi:murein DD-endopeptidase MepM/ murein hydrolase activator NlpD